MQQTSFPPTPATSPTHAPIRRDIAMVVAVPVAAALLAAYFELNERVFSFTRQYEQLQLDEWPIVVFVLALALMWLSWRRYRLARAELHARQAAEARLTQVLADNR